MTGTLSGVGDSIGPAAGKAGSSVGPVAREAAKPEIGTVAAAGLAGGIALGGVGDVSMEVQKGKKEERDSPLEVLLTGLTNRRSKRR